MSSTETRSPFKSRGFIAAAIVVGIIVLAGIVVLVNSLTRGGDPVTTAAPTPAGSAEPSSADASVCGLEGFEEESSLTSAPENEWVLVGTMAAPAEGSDAGPGEVDGTFRSCYAHTAEGALFAVVGYFAVSSDARNTSRLYELLASGGVREELEANPQEGDPSTVRLQVAGFKVNSYTAEEATIDVAWSSTTQQGALISLPMVVQWEGGDWKVLVPDSGVPYAPTQIQNLGGYIPWAGV
ncbi:hypothetical protein [Herbiconiux ginsengi]|uniref:DUF8175 domain-containing protein n=1 Tax=Herbiconiux ginsengi TaxID=381665 RepID=A0A1H3TFH3_9MICO|nr:hypothetical protein [Herbiconiux ginsengi]SDZ48591.1 hypothetical protein SAMN05216554_4141 [Herbiconiux ginsengi]